MNTTYKYFLIALFCLTTTLDAMAGFTFAGVDKKVITVKPDISTGLDDIYVIFDTRNATASFTAQSANATWQRFSSLGGGYAEDIECSRDGNVSTITLSTDDMGYIVTDGTQRYYCWIVNYANHYASFDALGFAAEQDCDRARLKLSGNAKRINYYTINGQAKELSRDLILDYRTLSFDEESFVYNQIDASSTITSVDEYISAPAPLCDTYFTLSGDRFLQEWGIAQQVESSLYDAIQVQAYTKAESEERTNDNEQKVDGGALGGSAPVNIQFNAVVTDKAIFREWQISRNPEFEPVDDRYSELDFSYTFTDNGTTYVRFVADNAQGSCEYVGETYEVFVGESALVCPNAFSPYGSEGVNDVWKVSYKSIISFECHIFNRWGQKLCSFTDPGQGWDGKSGGKIVPAGVYFYVIKAVGSDGRKYNLKGDINIVKSSRNQNQNQTEEE